MQKGQSSRRTRAGLRRVSTLKIANEFKSYFIATMIDNCHLSLGGLEAIILNLIALPSMFWGLLVDFSFQQIYLKLFFLFLTRRKLFLLQIIWRFSFFCESRCRSTSSSLDILVMIEAFFNRFQLSTLNWISDSKIKSSLLTARFLQLRRMREDQKSIDKPAKLARIKIIQEVAWETQELRRKPAEYFIATL